MNMFSVISLIFFLLMGVSFISAAVFVAIWTYKDAKERGLPAGLWTFIVVLFSKDLLGILLYVLIGRRDSRFACPNCGEKTLTRGKHCSECGTPIDAAKIPVFRNARKWLVAFGIALAVGFGSIFGFFISAVAQPPEGLNNISIGSFSNGVGNEWTYTAMYSTQTQTRDFYITDKLEDELILDATASSGTVTVLVSLADETPLVGMSYPLSSGTDEFVVNHTTIPLDFPEGTRIRLTIITDRARDVDFSATLS